MADDVEVLSGRYQLGSILGRGGMAEVYLGKDLVLGRQIAVKVLGSQFARDNSFVTRFRREAQSAAKLNHPNVVSVFDTGSDDGTHFIVMEYVQGRTLSQLIRDGGPLLPERAVEIASAVARALAFAHEAGLVHRDVKPGNIMLTPSGDVKVMDFGIARATASESLTQTATVLGTATYFSPEQAQGEAVDARSDVYSLGVVLYEMLTGHPPFSGETAVSVAYKHVREDPVAPSRLNPEVSEELDAVVLKCLAKNPANRYQSANDLLADLERLQAGMPVQATPVLPMEATQVVERATRPTTVMPPVRDEDSRRRKVIAGVIIGLIALAFGVALFFLARSLLGGSELVTVPDVTDRPRNVAEGILTDAGLEPDDEVTEVPNPAEAGIVVDYEPKGDVEIGTIIHLTISSGPGEVDVPDVICQPRGQAFQLLRREGLDPELAGQEQNDECDRGTVARTDPPAGETVEAGTTVQVFMVPAEFPAPSAPDLAPGSDSGSSSDDNVTNQTSLTFNGTAEPNMTVTLFRDGAQVGSTSSDGSGNWSVADQGPVPEGTSSYTARATDNQGQNSEMSAATEVTVDTTAPNTEITSGPEEETSETTATFEFTSSEGGSSFACQLDGGGFEGCTSPTTYSDLALGPHTFEVRATDPAGNADASADSYTWTVI